MSINLTQLENGLRVATDAMEGVESASLGLWVGVGTRHEDPTDNGVAHLVEHMLFKGTKRRSAFDISAQMENVGGHLNAYTTREATAYHAQVLKSDVPLAADILCDMLQNATLDEKELERERGVIIQEIGQSLDQPEDVLFDLVQKKAWGQAGLGRPVLGTAEIIKNIPRPRLSHYLSTHYATPQIVLAAAGAVKHEEIVELAQKHLSHMPTRASTLADKASFSGGDVREARDIEQLHALISFKGLSWADADYYALCVFSTLLGGGMSSRLFQEVREKRGLVYSIYSYVSAFRDGGMLGIYAGTDPDRIQELLPVVAGELRAVAAGVKEEELARAKSQLRASLFMAQESSMSRAERLASNLLMHKRIIGHGEVVAKIEAVTVDDIKRLAAKLLSGCPVTGFVGPLGNVPGPDAVAKIFAC
ncbi:MAG TPA: pitrilysin family protein [Alphaproteobacteria bacterium]|nr:pitrilysin family protein [Alphaproteobacteria bacterium]